MRGFWRTRVAVPMMFLMWLTLAGCGTANTATGSGSMDLGASQETGAAQEAVYRKISAEKAKEMIDAGGVVVVDVRTQDEYDAGHIEGAKLLPVNEIAERAETELPDKAAILLVHCRSGSRSAQAAKALVDMGYTGVYDMGGLLDWPYELVVD